MRVRGLLVAGMMAFAALFVGARAQADELRVAIDEAIPVRLAGPASGVAVGNPSVVGVSIQDERMIFITGRSYGSTNVVVVGDGGRLLFAGRVLVEAVEGEGAVMVTRGLATSRLTCSPMCRPDPDIGDDQTTYSQANNQIQSHASRAGR